MDIIHTATGGQQLSDVKLWHCRGCGVIHLAIGGRVMNFHRSEFSAFADAVIDAQYSLAESESHIPSIMELSHAGAGSIH